MESKELNIQEMISEQGDPRSLKLISLAANPIKLLKQAGKDGIRTVRKFISMLILMIMTNMFVFVYIVYSYFTGDGKLEGMGWILLVFLLDILFTILCAYRGYQYLLMEVMHQLYNSLEGVFRSLSLRISEKAIAIVQKKDTGKNAGLNKLANASELVRNYFNKSPRVLRWGMNILLSKIPFYTFLKEMDGDFQRGDSTAAADKLYLKTDGWIRENVFSQNTTRWMWIILLLNQLISLLIWYFKIEA